MTANNPNGDEERFRDFYSDLKAKLQIYRDAKLSLDRFQSTDFNVFRWIEPANKDLLPDQIRRFEDRRSAIIADLLRPSGSHGQQRKFLDAFLQIIERPDLKDKKYRKVATQVSTPLGKFDILVEFENFGIVIENKLEAPEQPRQLQRYLDCLKKEYGDQGFCLIYLTPNKRDPISIEEDTEKLLREKKLICISYSRDMLKWVEECCQLCESDKFRWFLRDFMAHMNGGQTMSMQYETEIILKHALREENLETALDINTAFNGDLHGQIITDFLHKLEKFVLHKLSQRHDGSQWEVNNKTLLDSPLPQYADFSFGRRSWGPRCGVGLQLQPPKDNEDRVRKVIIGVWKPEDDLWPSELEERLRNELNRRLGRNVNRSTRGWPWYFYLNDDPYANWNGKDALIKLYNGHEAVEYFGQYLVDIIEGAEQFIGEHVGTS